MKFLFACCSRDVVTKLLEERKRKSFSIKDKDTLCNSKGKRIKSYVCGGSLIHFNE